MDLTEPIQLREGDLSGTPVAVIEGARRAGNLLLIGNAAAIREKDVAVEFPMGEVAQRQTGYGRFLRFKSGKYALVGAMHEGVILPQVQGERTNLSKAIEERDQREAQRDNTASIGIIQAQALAYGGNSGTETLRGQ